MIAIGVLIAVIGFAQCQDDPQAVVFSTGLAHNATYEHDDTVLFDKINANLGNGYDPSTGVFTCPTAGIYAFQFHSLSHLGSSTWLELYKNDNYIASIFGHSDNDYAAGGNSVVLTLAKNDKVYIKAVDQQWGYPVELYGDVNEVYTTFGGYMLARINEEIGTVGK